MLDIVTNSKGLLYDGIVIVWEKFYTLQYQIWKWGRHKERYTLTPWDT